MKMALHTTLPTPSAKIQCQKYLHGYWPYFDQALKVGSGSFCNRTAVTMTLALVTVTFVKTTFVLFLVTEFYTIKFFDPKSFLIQILFCTKKVSKYKFWNDFFLYPHKPKNSIVFQPKGLLLKKLSALKNIFEPILLRLIK